jgi:hypothetical protein
MWSKIGINRSYGHAERLRDLPLAYQGAYEGG